MLGWIVHPIEFNLQFSRKKLTIEEHGMLKETAFVRSNQWNDISLQTELSQIVCLIYTLLMQQQKCTFLKYWLRPLKWLTSQLTSHTALQLQKAPLFCGMMYPQKLSILVSTVLQCSLQSCASCSPAKLVSSRASSDVQQWIRTCIDTAILHKCQTHTYDKLYLNI